MNQRPDISIITINYNGLEETCHYNNTRKIVRTS